MIREKELAFDAQLSATEIVRRCERRIGELVREGQRNGSVRTHGEMELATTVANSKVGPDTYFNGNADKEGSYAMAAAPVELDQFA